MGTAYTKTSPTNFVDGETINASDFTTEFDAIDAAFETGGHQHDGTDGEGGAIEKLLSNTITFGTGVDTDISVTFNANSNDGVLTWMEDEDYFKFDDKIMIIDDTTLIFGSDSNWTIEYDENGDDDLVMTGSDISIESSTSAKPVLQLLNTNADANGSTIKFNKNGASVADSDIIGNVDFVSEDDGGNVHTYGRIRGTVVDMTGGQEEGSIEFYVAENDGTLTKGMDIVGLGSDANITVDISTHDGAAGGLKLGGTLVTSTATELNILDGKSFLDEDDMSSNSATGIPSQQSVKAYVDAEKADMSFVLEDGDGTEVTINKDNEVKFVEGGGLDIDWTDTDNGTDGDPYDLTFTVNATQTGITSLTNTSLVIGRDADNDIDFATDNTIIFRAEGADQVKIIDGVLAPVSDADIDLGSSSLQFKDAYIHGTLEADAITLNGTALGSLYSPIAGSSSIVTTGALDSGSITSGFGTINNGSSTITTTGAVSGGSFVVPDDGDIGSASATDAIQISSGGIVTFKDDIKIKDGGTIGVASAADAMTVSSAGIVTFKDDILIKDGGTIGVASAATAMTIASSGIVTFVDDIIIKDAGTIGSASDTDALSISSGGVVNFTQAPTVASAAVKTAGKETIFVPAAACQPTASNGCAALANVETTSGRPDMQVLDFDNGSDEHAQFQVAFPKSWNEGTVTFQVFWTTTATDTDGVAWGLQGVAVSDNDTIDVAYGSAVVVTDDALSAAEDLCVTAESGAVTIAGSPAANDMCFFRIFRDVSDANDDMAEDARLIGIKLFYTTDAANDA